jgi:hypothetical protein
MAGNIYSNQGSDLLMIGGSVSGNQGNGVFTQDSSSILINVTIHRNTGSGAGHAGTSTVRLINVTITGNDSGWIRNIDVGKAVYNSDVEGTATGITGVPVNSKVNGVGGDNEKIAYYWPVADGGLNTAVPYEGPNADGEDLRVVYNRLNGLPDDIKTEIISLLGDPPAKAGVKE